MGFEQPRSSGGEASSQSKSTESQRSRRSRDEIAADDKKRDSRNVERRKVIKRRTSEKRGSLVDSLLIAKNVIDGHTQNKEYEEKATERRQKIKQRNSDPGPRVNDKRRKSFAEEVQSACSVIKPNWDDDEKLEQTKEKCREIKHQISAKHRPSLLDEIEVAREVIGSSERKYSYQLPSTMKVKQIYVML